MYGNKNIFWLTFVWFLQKKSLKKISKNYFKNNKLLNNTLLEIFSLEWIIIKRFRHVQIIARLRHRSCSYKR